MSNLLAIQPVSIRAETSLSDPDTCRFNVSCTVYPGGPFFFDNNEQAASSPLGERLFAERRGQRAYCQERGDHLQGPERLVVRTESSHRRTVINWRAGYLGDVYSY